MRLGSVRQRFTVPSSGRSHSASAFALVRAPSLSLSSIAERNAGRRQGKAHASGCKAHES